MNSTDVRRSGGEPPLFFILHDVRSAYNIGAIFRTADGVGVAKIFLTGYTCAPHDGRRAWQTKPERMIGKTALGADRVVPWEKRDDIAALLAQLRAAGVFLCALEACPEARPLATIPARGRAVAVLLGNEPRGLPDDLRAACDGTYMIPMRGAKSSLNVAVAAGVAGYAIAAAQRSQPCP